MIKSSLKDKLEYHYKFFDKTKISPDPLEFLHRYSDPIDIEIAGIISSVFAYGNVNQINKTLNKIHAIMDSKPHKFVLNYNSVKSTNVFNRTKHRFYTSNDIDLFFHVMNRIYSSKNSIQNIFENQFLENNRDLKLAISGFSKELLGYVRSNKNTLSRGIKFMFPDPAKGSACKRMNLFLRWMVRKDELDFGLWKNILPSEIIIPVDTHVAKICRKLNLTSRKNVSWQMAEEITNNLKKIDPDDPVKYDFAICHIGMRKMKF